MEKVAYKGWPNCCRLANGKVELIATLDVGPRIIRFGFLGGENELKEFPDQVGLTGGLPPDEWRIYGGHRLWHAPEVRPRSYLPDNGPVAAEDLGGFVRLTQPTEPGSGIQKQIDLALSPRQAAVKVTHRLRNDGPWPVELAPWALSVMAPGGVAVIPLPPPGSHEANLGANGLLGLWAYTDLTDPRWTIGRKYILLRQDPAAAGPQKIGACLSAGWTAYARGGPSGRLFVKKADLVPGGQYPDGGCSVEVFTNADMLELETLAPLVHLQPGAAVEHVEHWRLLRDVPTPQNDANVDRDVLPLIKTAN
jgi:hypothetical protein